MPADLSNKRCIVTGGATGIGRASAVRLAELGAQVAIFDNNNEDGNNTSIEINENGGNSRFWSVDVRDEANVSGTVVAAKAWLGDIDVLCNFAGVLIGASVPLEDFDEKTWDTVLDINLRGTYLMAKYVVAEMLKKPGPDRRDDHPHRIWRWREGRVVVLRLRSEQRGCAWIHYGHAAVSGISRHPRQRFRARLSRYSVKGGTASIDWRDYTATRRRSRTSPSQISQTREMSLRSSRLWLATKRMLCVG